jgi:magnesium transporter
MKPGIKIKDPGLNKSLKKLLDKNTKDKLHPSEIALLLNELKLKEALDVFNTFTPERQTLVFPYLGAYLQQQLISKISDRQKDHLLNHLGSADRHTLLMSLKGLQRSELLERLDKPKRSVAEKMLGYAPRSVGHLLNTEFVTLKKDMTVAEAIAFLKKHQPDTDAADVLYIVDDQGKLLDDMPIRRLVLNDPDKHIAEIMDHHFVCLEVNEPLNEATGKFEQYDRSVLPVTAPDKLLLGIVTINDIIDAARHRGTQEMQRFGGVKSLEYPYVKTSLFSLIR